MIVEHSLKFVTEFKEGHPVTLQMQAMPEALRIQMLEGLLKDLVAPKLTPILDHINEGGSYAILKVVA
jgi:hypothetical protein